MEDIRALTGIVIDPGHGGRDSGTTYKNIYEKVLSIPYVPVCGTLHFLAFLWR